MRPGIWRESVWAVWRKELKESLRDRRALLHTLLTGPLLAPLAFALVVHVLVAREIARAEAPLPVPVVGAEHAPNLVASLERQGARILPPPVQPEEAVRQQKTDVVLRIPKEFPEAWNRGDPAPVEILFDASQRDAAGPLARLRGMLETYGRETGAIRLLARGVPPSAVVPLQIRGLDQSTSRSRAGILFGILPYFFILGGFVGGMALAIDATAGERERQSLEPLLGTPGPRGAIVLGKVGATVSLGAASVGVALAAFAAVAPLLPVDRLGMSLDLGLRFALPALAVLLPLVALMGTLQNAVSAWARTHREAQTYLSLLMFLPALPSMLLAVIPVQPGWGLWSLPVVGQQLLLVRLLRGEAVPWGAWAVGASITVFLAAFAFFLTVRRYRSRSIVLG